ncbi:SDR family NAD(P)-dependent oxidoreductase [Nocardia jiangxiensis]|uniref:SDR family NAD(P)-dependent oxidoreductase n=1 Tax=Nocardia jiangxiensis TaxID=282685 RepID=A0ABW6SC55_9NOCA|nr:SDR family NAD(P)-dependent oxidoreductase [Nocardia jiangxiensis]
MKICAGQVGVVTGGASGIGYGLAAALAARGVNVVIADRRRDAIDRVVERLVRPGIEVLPVEVDVSDASSVQKLAEVTVARFGRVDLVCNNAGVNGKAAPIWEQDLPTWNWLVGVHLYGLIHGVRAFAPIMIEQGFGYFLNTASIGGLIPLPGLGPYNATKHAVVGMTETLDQELRAACPALGASVLCPGLVETSLKETSAMNRPVGVETVEATSDVSAERASLRAAWGSVLTPADVAEIALAGVEARRLHILPNNDSAAPVRARVDRLIEDLPEPQ